ncbi:MAG: transposase [Phycisphaerae bacterium]|nr:transposase [Phycisphaerae bacterium]
MNNTLQIWKKVEAYPAHRGLIWTLPVRKQVKTNPSTSSPADGGFEIPDVSWESLVQVHTDQVLEGNRSSGDSSDDPTGRKKKSSKPQRRSTTDPDATMTTSSHSFHMEPSYKQHGAVDDQCGIIVDIDVTTGQVNEGKQLADQLERIEANLGQKPETATADKGYAHGANYEHLEQEQIEAIIPPQTSKTKSSCIPSCRFK